MASKNHVTIARKSDEPKGKRPPARTEQDWIEQEKAETVRPVFQDPISEALGDSFFIQHAGYEAWRHPRTGQRFTCSRFYVHRKVVIDFPDRETEADAKREALKSIGIAYVGILPGNPVKAGELIQQVDFALAKLKVKQKPAPAAAESQDQSADVQTKGKAKRLARAAAMVFLALICYGQLSAATTAVYQGDYDVVPRGRTDTHERIMGTYQTDINGNSISANSSANGATLTANQGTPGTTAWPVHDTQTASVADSLGNTSKVVSLPQEDLTAYNTYNLVSYTVTAVNLTTTVGAPCPLGMSWWLVSPSANIYFMYGDLTFSPSVSQIGPGMGHQLAANALPPVAPYPAYSGSKLFFCGNGGAAIVSVVSGPFRIK